MSELSDLRAQVEELQAARSLDQAHAKIDAALQQEAPYASPVIGQVVKSQIGQMVANEDLNETRTATAVKSLLATSELKALMLRAMGAEPMDQPVATQRPPAPASESAGEKPQRKTLVEMLGEVKNGQANFRMRH